MTTAAQAPNEAVRVELESSKLEFVALLARLGNADFRRQSLNPGWTNGEIIAHMVFGFTITNAFIPLTRWWGHLPSNSSKPFAMLLDAFTGPFNWFNALGARGQGRVGTHDRAGRVFERAHASLLRHAARLKDDEWQRGMYYPTKWDGLFDEFMTLEKIFHYPTRHFHFHLTQLAE